MSRKKIAILGGAYDPITLGHIDIAKYVLKNTEIEEVWLSPCNDHLQKHVIASSKDRLEMCYIATNENPDIYVSVYEINKNLDGSAYTFVTEIKKLWGDKIDFYYIIGMDNVHNFSTWIRAEELKSIIKFIVVPRVGVETCKDVWYQKYPHRFLNNEKGIINTSSTEIRELLKEWWIDPNIVNSKMPSLIDNKVLSYIAVQGIYRS